MPLTTHNVGNCNFSYVDYLKQYWPEVKNAVWDLVATNNGGPFKPNFSYKRGTIAIILFAQGSEDDVAKIPYAPKLAEYIQEQKLGTVHDSGPAPNYLHGNKPGRLYMWVIDWDALYLWFEREREERINAKAKASPPKI